MVVWISFHLQVSVCTGTFIRGTFIWSCLCRHVHIAPFLYVSVRTNSAAPGLNAENPGQTEYREQSRRFPVSVLKTCVSEA